MHVELIWADVWGRVESITRVCVCTWFCTRFFSYGLLKHRTSPLLFRYSAESSIAQEERLTIVFCLISH